MDVVAPLQHARPVAVVVLDDPDRRCPGAGSGRRALPFVEVPVRTDAARDAIGGAVLPRGDILVGAGTVLNPLRSTRPWPRLELVVFSVSSGRRSSGRKCTASLPPGRGDGNRGAAASGLGLTAARFFMAGAWTGRRDCGPGAPTGNASGSSAPASCRTCGAATIKAVLCSKQVHNRRAASPESRSSPGSRWQLTGADPTTSWLHREQRALCSGGRVPPPSRGPSEYADLPKKLFRRQKSVGEGIPRPARVPLLRTSQQPALLAAYHAGGRIGQLARIHHDASDAQRLP